MNGERSRRHAGPDHQSGRKGITDRAALEEARVDLVIRLNLSPASTQALEAFIDAKIAAALLAILDEVKKQTA